MNALTDQSTIVRPSIHYLDLIAKIRTKHGTISGLSVKKINDFITVQFSHTYPNCEICFNEKLIYNNNYEILHWTVTTNNQEIVLYNELSRDFNFSF